MPKNIFKYLIILILTLGVTGGFAKNRSSSDLRLHILFTNDLHGSIDQGKAWFMNPSHPPDLGGGAGMYHYARQLRAEAEVTGDAVLMVDAGNFYQGTPLGISDSGRTMIKWMNWMGYDAGVFGSYEFMHGVENARALSELAHFPLLSANLVQTDDRRNPDFVSPSQLLDLGELKVGILGVTTAETKNLLLPRYTESIDFDSPIHRGQKEADELKAAGADLVLGLVHLGVPYRRDEVFDEIVESTVQDDYRSAEINSLHFAHQVSGIDAIFSGHISAGYNTPWEDPETHTLVFQGYGNGSNIGHVTLLLDRTSKRVKGYELPTKRGGLVTLTTDDVPVDPEMASSIRNWAESANQTNWSVPDYADLKSKPPDYLDLETVSLLQIDKFPVPSYNEDDRLEVVTWNMEHFPKLDDSTIIAVAEIMTDIAADVYAVQEVGDIAAFTRLMDQLPQYGASITRQSSYYDQAILYRRDVLSFLMQTEPFAEQDYFFAGRPPQRVDLLYHSGEVTEVISVVNLHLKCCGDGLYRRKKSMDQLHDYLRFLQENGMENIIVLGDWNDEVLDRGQEQSFPAFVEDPENFRFVTEEISRDVKQASYPSWPSFLDHILIGVGLFEAFDSDGYVETLPIEDWVGGWEQYEYLISDHRPVLMRVPID